MSGPSSQAPPLPIVSHIPFRSDLRDRVCTAPPRTASPALERVAIRALQPAPLSETPAKAPSRTLRPAHHFSVTTAMAAMVSTTIACASLSAPSALAPVR
jgi:hypothetical protein